MTLAPRIVDEQAFLAAKGFRAKAIEWQDKAITACSHGDIELAEIHRATAQGYQNRPRNPASLHGNPFARGGRAQFYLTNPAPRAIMMLRTGRTTRRFHMALNHPEAKHTPEDIMLHAWDMIHSDWPEVTADQVAEFSGHKPGKVRDVMNQQVAMGHLSRKEFEDALADYEAIVKKGMERAQAKLAPAAQPQNPPQQGGATMRYNPATGKIEPVGGN